MGLIARFRGPALGLLVTVLLVGSASAAEVRAGVAHFRTPVPPEFWADLQSERLIDERAPAPERRFQAAAQ